MTDLPRIREALNRIEQHELDAWALMEISHAQKTLQGVVNYLVSVYGDGWIECDQISDSEADGLVELACMYHEHE